METEKLENVTTGNLPENLQKQKNYQEQFKRLEKAIHNGFYLEAMFIAYAILEDRTESILRHAEKWDAYIKSRKGRDATIDSKIKYIQNIAREKKTLPNKYFGDDLLANILQWKEDRNRMIHALMKQSLTTEELEALALTGREYARALANRATSYRRAVEQRKKKDAE